MNVCHKCGHHWSEIHANGYNWCGRDWHDKESVYIVRLGYPQPFYVLTYHRRATFLSRLITLQLKLMRPQFCDGVTRFRGFRVIPVSRFSKTKGHDPLHTTLIDQLDVSRSTPAILLSPHPHLRRPVYHILHIIISLQYLGTRRHNNVTVDGPCTRGPRYQIRVPWDHVIGHVIHLGLSDGLRYS